MDLGVISLNSEVQSWSSSNGWDNDNGRGRRKKSYKQRTDTELTEYRWRTEKPLTEAPLIVVPIEHWVEGADMFETYWLTSMKLYNYERQRI